MLKWITGVVIGLVVVAAAARSAFFVVDETQYAIVTTFGKPVRTITAAGPNWKWPAPIQSVLSFDKRLQIFDPRPTEMFTLDRKNLVVDTFVLWEVEEPQRFLSKVGSIAGAENSLAVLLASEMSAELGKHELSDLLSTETDDIKVVPIVNAVTERCIQAAKRDYGIRVVDAGIKRINLPPENKESVYERMRAEREQKARQYRAEGQEEATIIRAKTDLEKRQILAAAYKEAQTKKGEGDADALRIYAAAYDQAPEFYKFMRTLDAYKGILRADTTVLMSSDSELLRLLTDFDPAAMVEEQQADADTAAEAPPQVLTPPDTPLPAAVDVPGEEAADE